MAGSAPTMTLRRPCSASTGVRASGASTSVTPLAAHAARSRAVTVGSDVDVSTTTSPGRAPASTPVSDVSTESTSAAPVTQM